MRALSVRVVEKTLDAGTQARSPAQRLPPNPFPRCTGETKTQPSSTL